MNEQQFKYWVVIIFPLKPYAEKNTHKQSEQMYGWSSWEIDKMQTKQIATAIKQKWMHKKPARR